MLTFISIDSTTFTHFVYKLPQITKMIRKLEEYLWRITKELEGYILLIFYHSSHQSIRLKIVENNQVQKKCFFKDLKYEQMPDLIRFNFQNLSEIFEEIRITSKDCFHFEKGSGLLRISLQIGSKLKQCIFQLQQTDYTYTQSIELLLCSTQREMERTQQPQQLYLRELQQLRAVNQHHTKAITHLSLAIEKEKLQRQSMQQQFQAYITQLRTEFYQMKMNIQSKYHSQMEEQSQPQPINRRVEYSSLICQDKGEGRSIHFITIEDEQFLSKIQVYNKMQLSSCKFKLDINAGNDITNSFQRRGQRITKRKMGQHRQYSSLLHLPSIALLSFKLIKTKQHNICVGVVHYDRVKQLSTRREQRAISYKLKGYQLWQDGFKMKDSLERIQKVNVGEILSVFINGVRKVMQWWKSGRLLIERSIPPGFDNQQMYPFVNMIHEGDTIEFV